MAYFICPNCGLRSMDSDGRDGLTHQAVGCARCGFGFMFELLDDFYPGPGAGMLACGKDARVLAVGRGVFELTGFQEGELLGKDPREALALRPLNGDADPVGTVLEWGVRKLDLKLELRHRVGTVKTVRADLFPAYDADGGLLICLAPFGAVVATDA
jgi:hypothetical protein